MNKESELFYIPRESKAYKAAIKLLTKRDYSCYKLMNKLVEKEFDTDDIADTIKTLLKKRYLREDYYIEARVKAFIRKNCSISYIQQKLAAEHLDVSRDLIKSIFDEKQISEEDQIKNLTAKKKTKVEILESDDYEEKQRKRLKLVRFLNSKGHYI